jgi:hypothetical protein
MIIFTKILMYKVIRHVLTYASETHTHIYIYIYKKCITSFFCNTVPVTGYLLNILRPYTGLISEHQMSTKHRSKNVIRSLVKNKTDHV